MRDFPYATGTRQRIVMKQRLGRDAHVEASVNSPNGISIHGRYLTDNGDYFAIRFERYIAVYHRELGYTDAVDYGTLLMLIPR